MYHSMSKEGLSDPTLFLSRHQSHRQNLERAGRSQNKYVSCFSTLTSLVRNTHPPKITIGP